jgi:hypothetical protein
MVFLRFFSPGLAVPPATHPASPGRAVFNGRGQWPGKTELNASGAARVLRLRQVGLPTSRLAAGSPDR